MTRTAARHLVLACAAGAVALLVGGCASPRSAARGTASALSAPQLQPASASSSATAPLPTPTSRPTPPTTPTAAPATPTPTAPPSEPVVPHFATPDAAMRYLVAAYNSHDLAAEMHVTTPDSRAALESERQWVKEFAFRSCTKNPGGDYSCVFDMTERVPAASASATPTQPSFDSFGSDPASMNEITVLVAPADRPGWYMYFNFGCGDAGAAAGPSPGGVTTSS